MMLSSDYDRILRVFKILWENIYLPSMVFTTESLWAEPFQLSTDFQNFCNTFKDKISTEFCKENILPIVK